MWYKPRRQPFADCVSRSVYVQGLLAATKEAAAFHDQRPSYTLHFS